MKALMLQVPDNLLEQRRRTGADRWDEMWNGVLHMSPAPSRMHQDFLDELRGWLMTHWALPLGNRVHREVNVAPIGGWPHDYRIPDLVLLTPEQFGIDHNEYFAGPPLVCIEIHSPGDEAYEKLDFYAELGVPEVWIIHRDTRKPQVFVLRRGSYSELAAVEEGWLCSPATSIRMKSKRVRKLAMQFGNDEQTRASLPTVS